MRNRRVSCPVGPLATFIFVVPLLGAGCRGTPAGNGSAEQRESALTASTPSTVASAGQLLAAVQAAAGSPLGPGVAQGFVAASGGLSPQFPAAALAGETRQAALALPQLGSAAMHLAGRGERRGGRRLAHGRPAGRSAGRRRIRRLPSGASASGATRLAPGAAGRQRGLREPAGAPGDAGDRLRHRAGLEGRRAAPRRRNARAARRGRRAAPARPAALHRGCRRRPNRRRPGGVRLRGRRRPEPALGPRGDPAGRVELHGAGHLAGRGGCLSGDSRSALDDDRARWGRRASSTR